MLFFSDTNGEEYALLEDGWKGLSLGRIGTILNEVPEVGVTGLVIISRGGSGGGRLLLNVCG